MLIDFYIAMKRRGNGRQKARLIGQREIKLVRLGRIVNGKLTFITNELIQLGGSFFVAHINRRGVVYLTGDVREGWDGRAKRNPWPSVTPALSAKNESALDSSLVQMAWAPTWRIS